MYPHIAHQPLQQFFGIKSKNSSLTQVIQKIQGQPKKIIHVST